jgi:hypothetical protein
VLGYHGSHSWARLFLPPYLSSLTLLWTLRKSGSHGYPGVCGVCVGRVEVKSKEPENKVAITVAFLCRSYWEWRSFSLNEDRSFESDMGLNFCFTKNGMCFMTWNDKWVFNSLRLTRRVTGEPWFSSVGAIKQILQSRFEWVVGESQSFKQITHPGCRVGRTFSQSAEDEEHCLGLNTW